MAPEHPDAPAGDTTALALKILVSGGFGVGKTTLVGAVSEIRPLRTEEMLSEAGRTVDDTDGVDHKVTTTVAIDFGRTPVAVTPPSRAAGRCACVRRTRRAG